MSLPSFLCIGAQKAATSWLWSMLRQHPEIWMPPLKEIHYFDHLYVPENRSWTHMHIKKGVRESLKWHVTKGVIDLQYFKYLVNLATEKPFTENWYRYCFSPPAANNKKLGDVTPEYSTIPQEGVEYVKRLLGNDLKLIYIIRNPVERALSQLKMNLTRKGMERENENVWLQASKDPVIMQRGDYETYVPRWESVFPKKNILYVPYKDVKNNPSGLLQQTEELLGISNHSYQEIDKRVHKTKEAQAPQVAIDYLEQALAPQSKFLKTHFGEAFYADT